MTKSVNDMPEIPKELQGLADLLIGIASTLEKVRDLTFTTEIKISEIEDKLNSLENLIKEKNNTNFNNRVIKWLKHTKK